MKRLKENENVLVLGGFLGITALISALVLALVFTVTRGPIEKMQQKSIQAKLYQCLYRQLRNLTR